METIGPGRINHIAPDCNVFFPISSSCVGSNTGEGALSLILRGTSKTLTQPKISIKTSKEGGSGNIVVVLNRSKFCSFKALITF